MPNSGIGLLIFEISCKCIFQMGRRFGLKGVTLLAKGLGCRTTMNEYRVMVSCEVPFILAFIASQLNMDLTILST